MGRKQLIDLLIAEGLVQQVGRVTPEEMADSYLLELTRRSMLQVYKRTPNGNPIKFKMHDLLRELALSVSEAENFCTVITGEQGNMEIKARRLSLQGSNVQLRSYRGLSKVRTLFVFSPSIIPSSLSAVLSSLRWVAVLNLRGTPIVELPPEIAYFFNLIYLNLSKTNIERLPKSIGNLCNLQRLDVSGSKIENLPCEITKLKRLEILNVWQRSSGGDFDSLFFNGGVWAPSNICELKNLNKLSLIRVGDDLLKRLRYMTQLRALSVAEVKEAHEKDLCISIEGMKLLKRLCVSTVDRNEVLRMDALSSVPPSLDKLLLCGKLEKVLHWFTSLHTLTSLALYRSKLTEDCLPYIQMLPNLRELWLRHTHVGSRLCFSSGFQNLSILEVHGFPTLNEIIIVKGVMPCIYKLMVGNCKELKSLPHGIEHLSNLRKLYLDRMPDEFIASIRGEESVDRHKVQHISRITHSFKTQSGLSFEDLS
ncbi:LRR domain containing protein [Trema orientale]|uniref:LRR domain containing protein n=1 Tax=Trema orientale TaxID=63057 RepID=A0A2P5E9D2_TREOI|nr:LRR domain containing protein [Trema orientale]